eukprot:3338671-Ditylum_brightwellii.AAC.1
MQQTNDKACFSFSTSYSWFNYYIVRKCQNRLFLATTTATNAKITTTWLSPQQKVNPPPFFL